MGSSTAKKVKDIILIVDDDVLNLEMLRILFTRAGQEVLTTVNGHQALQLAESHKPDIILLDIIMPEIDGYETCRLFKKNKELQQIPIIFMTVLNEIGDKIRGFEVGGVDFISKPVQNEEVLARIATHLALRKLQEKLEEANEELELRVTERTAELARSNADLRAEIVHRKRAEELLRNALAEVERLKNRLQAENIYLQEEIKLAHNFDSIISRNKTFKSLLGNVEKVATTVATVLIQGETGTGKELIARAIHNISDRRGLPLVKVNCAALSPSLIESELFGHEKGAFTGANSRKVGRFELADRGTIFLDEIGELPVDLQSKILRILQEGEFERLGGNKTIKVDVRIIAATNRNLRQAMESGDFREDLYYRLNVFPITIPPLRERTDDISLLVNHFVKLHSSKIGKKIEKISTNLIDKLLAYSWPGNIRELENLIERAIILSKDSILHVDDLPLDVALTEKPVASSSGTLQSMEHDHIKKILETCNWIIEGKRGAARRLDIAPSTLRDKMKKLRIVRPKEE
ncbi:sigma-54-dependent transcriptional regulator [candidate division CSSED10-310 bacterium]|uniref:Sigma-54-dependent transcriptional regulator n=1 Tax=candidate division CSSED10-310 bacterium TaxID=2855610 RepID=A0ABV6YWH6_UNCC1